jgi:threonine dehydrogenase-like Zn-dependent dehydrogenase
MGAQIEYGVTFTARERAELREIARPPEPLAAGEIAGRTLATLISAGTELEGAYLGEQFPRSPGYAAIFEVEAAGDAVTRFRPGDRAYCMGPHRSFQRATEDRALPVPTSLPPAEAAFARMVGVTMSTLVTTTARPPDRVLVTGLGLVGHLGAQVFQSCGYRVAAVDPSACRREFAAAQGLRVLESMPLDDPEWAEQVALVVECSGHEQAALEACRIVRKKGEVALVGAPWRRRTEITAQELLHLVFFRYVVLRSGWEWELPMQPAEFREGSIFENYAAALRWIQEGRVRVSELYTLVHPRECQAAYQELLHQRTERLAVVFDWTSL